MKKLFIFLLSVALVGCDKAGINNVVSPEKGSPVFYASVESVDSRTYLDEGAKMRWTNDDRISIFVGENYNREFAFTGATGSTAGGFAQKSTDGFYTAEKVSANYAVYPFSSSTLLETEGYFKLSMPAMQSYAEDSFGLNANTMVAVTESTSDMFLQFKNVCGYLKLNLYGSDVTVKRITLQGNNDEAIAGMAKITPAFEGNPTLEWEAGATATTLKLDCAQGVKIGESEDAATAFWLVVPPTVFEKGFTIRVVDTNNKMYEKSTTSKQTFTRNISKNMPALQVVCDQDAPIEGDEDSGVDDTPVVTYEVPNNQIWYKTKYDFAVVLATETLTNANLMAHTYENGIGKLVFDNDVTKIVANAFDGLDPITHVWLPNCLTTIEDYAFRDCTGFTSITLPEGLTRIGRYAFSGCTSLTNIDLPNYLTTIDDSAFRDCTDLTSITLPESLTSIGVSAFSDCTSLTSITLPEGLTSIGDATYYRCTNLTNIDLPESLTSIGDSAFSGCTSLTSITLPEGLTSIGDSAFSGCTSLTNIDLPNCLTTIDDSAFRDCTGFTSITLPESLTSIGYYAFSGCTGLTSIKLPKSLKRIGISAFEGCTGKLTVCCNLPSSESSTHSPLRGSLFSEIEIMEGVTSIGQYAFYSCKGLTSITLPESLTSIGYGAFYYCTGLTSVYCRALTPPNCSSDTFYKVTATVYVPKEALSAYQTAQYWSDMNLVGYDFDE